ncbi:hypothetical protein Moror_2213 [Moniliophthora roreri MCA 2997]|uniref:Uncharacterized protein n=1 Tax=Moniliophthora roreri (strain MCA 2997) TaxID=1381753 RepID=V2WL81_MONRO|nr:hypothetical protein Moror_2213 [Moniliophthora roreri MCA 2997]
MGVYISTNSWMHIYMSVQIFFYGVCTVLLGICLHILLKRRKARHYKYHLLATITLFLLVSTNVLLCMIIDISGQCWLDRQFIPYDADGHCWTPTMKLH